MTDATAVPRGEGPARTRRPRRRKPSPFPVAAGSAASFLGLFAFLTLQLREGNDPALGSGASPPTQLAKKRVVIKRIEKKIIVTRVLPPRTVAARPAAVLVAGPAAAPDGAPVVVRSTPAPAPAPAPVVTRSS